MPLKLILISPDGTIGADGKARIDVLRDLCTFIAQMRLRNVEVALWSRHRSTLSGEPLDAYLSRESNTPVRHFLAGSGNLPIRRRGGSADLILAITKVQRHETLLVGSKEEDMLAGVQNKFLLVRPAWYGDDIEYGFRVASIGELARFCELFALRQHPIYWSITCDALQVRSMGPFSTLIEAYSNFGTSARRAAKDNAGEREFWFFAMVSSLYFSGIMHQVDCVCRFPGHNPTQPSGIDVLFDQVMSLFGKCFQKPYYSDLIVRHTKATKSQPIKADQRTFSNHLNTIVLNRRPRSYDRAQPRKTALILRNKTVLVVDDILTSGRSLDVARAYLQAAGASVILFAWLKTISAGFSHMSQDPSLDPFVPYVASTEPRSTIYGYHSNIVDNAAPDELDRILTAYREWSWP
jgi:hypothetical protein